MKTFKQIGLLLILLLIFISINQPIVDLSEVRARQPKNQFPEDFVCIEKYLPDGVTVLFFSEPDGTLSYEKADGQYFQLQYLLAPSMIIIFRDGNVDFNDYDWFIAHQSDQETIDSLASTYNMDLFKSCGGDIILIGADGY